MMRRALISLRRLRHSRRSVALVEFALILPSMIFVMMISTDVFYLVRLHNDMENMVNLIADELVLKNDITSCDLQNAYYFFNYIHRDRPFNSPVDENTHQLNIAIVEFGKDAFDKEGDGVKVSGMHVAHAFVKGKLNQTSFYAPTGTIYDEGELPAYASGIMNLVKGNYEFATRKGHLKALVVEAWAEYDAYWNFVVTMPTLISAGPVMTIHRGSSYSSFGKTVTVESAQTATCP